jgi:hypothetical protein
MRVPFIEAKERYVEFLESEIYRLHHENLDLKNQKPRSDYDITVMDMGFDMPSPRNYVEIPLQGTLTIENTPNFQKAIVLKYGKNKHAMYFQDEMLNDLIVIEHLMERFFFEIMDEKVKAIKVNKSLKDEKEKS